MTTPADNKKDINVGVFMLKKRKFIKIWPSKLSAEHFSTFYRMKKRGWERMVQMEIHLISKLKVFHINLPLDVRFFEMFWFLNCVDVS